MTEKPLVVVLPGYASIVFQSSPYIVVNISVYEFIGYATPAVEPALVRLVYVVHPVKSTLLNEALNP